MGERRRGLWVFLALFFANLYFHQGGSWNPNARMDQVRAIVETGRLSVNAFVSYGVETTPGGEVRVRRIPLPEPFAFGAEPPLLNSWDLAFRDGRFYPNKPPGATFLAVPAYAAILAAERIAGADRDAPWTLNVNLWLTGALSVGLLGALGGVLFLRISRRLFPWAGDRAHVAAALSLGFATPMLPYGTMLFDHVPVAVLLVASLDRILAGSDAPSSAGRAALGWLAAGFLAAFAVLANYAAVLAAALLTAYAAWRGGLRALAPWFAGALVPAAALLLYHDACFGSPFVIANTYQARIFADEGTRWLGVFGWPDAVAALRLVLGAYRGLLPSAPLLALAFLGLRWMARRGYVAEAALFVAIPTAFLLMNASFNQWHGGHAFGPRYLVPAVPFLALALTPVFELRPVLAVPAAAFSTLVTVLATAVTPLIPHEIGRPLTDFLLPLAAGNAVEVGPLRFLGPVSANLLAPLPLGFPERWSAFNVGEFVWPSSWASLLPLAILAGAASIAALRAGAPGARRRSSAALSGEGVGQDGGDGGGSEGSNSQRS